MEAVIIDCLRTAIGKAPKGTLRNTRPDDLAAFVVQALMKKYPQVPADEIEDFILGCAFPEGEAGMNMARAVVLRAGLPNTVPALTINRFCSSGLQAIALAAERIRAGSADLILAGGRLVGEQLVSEQYLLDLEREAFLSLCGNVKTQERMAHMLKTGKPLRN